MKIKLFTSIFESKLERKVNEFIAQPDIEVVEIKLSCSFGQAFVLVVYNNPLAG